LIELDKCLHRWRQSLQSLFAIKPTQHRTVISFNFK
jgi:hypothetical protein